MVGATLDSLVKVRTRPTLVCYVSDNGYLWGEHWLRESKWTPFEEASGIPLTCAGLNGLDVEARTDTTSLVQLIDLTATFLDYGSAQATHPQAGRSLRPVLETGATPPGWRTELLLEQQRPNVPKQNDVTQNYSCARTIRFKLCAFGSGESTLYDLAKYPHETVNAIHSAGYAQVLARLQAKLDSLKRLP
jgi:arylsulfatase A-like enzyme